MKKRVWKRVSKAMHNKLKKAVLEGRVEMGNEAVLANESTYITMFDHTRKGHGAGFQVHWHDPEVGFGELVFVVKHGKLEIQTEFMGLDFAKKQMMKLLDNAKITE